MNYFSIWFNYNIPRIEKQPGKPTNERIFYTSPGCQAIINEKNKHFSNDKEYYEYICKFIDPKKDIVISLVNNYFEICNQRNLKFDIFHPYFRIYFLSDYFKIERFKVCEFIDLFNTTIGYSLLIFRSICGVYSETNDVIETFQVHATIKYDLANNRCENKKGHKWRYTSQPFIYHDYTSLFIDKVLQIMERRIKYNMINWTLPIYDIIFLMNIIHEILEINGCLFISARTIYKYAYAEIISNLTLYFQSVNIIKTSEEYNEIFTIVCFGYIGNAFKPIRVGGYDISAQIKVICAANEENMKAKCRFIERINLYTRISTRSTIKSMNNELYLAVCKNYAELKIPLISIYGIEEKFEPQFKTLTLGSGSRVGSRVSHHARSGNHTGSRVSHHAKSSKLSGANKDTNSRVVGDATPRDATPAPEFYNMVYMVMNFIDLNKENGNYSRLARIENTKISAIIKSKFKRKHKYDISQAYLKCLELLRTVDIFDNNKSIKAFHVCEAPGQFIIAFTDFCKYKKIKYDWLAQSLNPKEYPKNDNIFGDYYGIIAANPERWIYGKNNTGDISNPDNVREYIEMANNSFDIATSDCGFNFGSGSDHDQSKMSYKIAAIRIGQYLSVTNTLKIGGSCFFKIFLPASHINVLVILQMMHEHFEDVIYFKPYLNAESPEFYVIGKKLRSFYSRDEREILFKLLVNANKEIPYKSTVPISATFYASHKKRIETILLNYSQAVNYQIYLSLLDDGEEQWNKVISICANKFKNKILLL